MMSSTLLGLMNTAKRFNKGLKKQESHHKSMWIVWLLVLRISGNFWISHTINSFVRLMITMKKLLLKFSSVSWKKVISTLVNTLVGTQFQTKNSSLKVSWQKFTVMKRAMSLVVWLHQDMKWS